MKIRIPRRIFRAYEAFYDWGNVPMFKLGRVQVCRVDPLILIAFLGSSVYGYWKGGWALAAVNALTFMLVGMVCLWMF